MAAGTTPIFIATPKKWLTQVSVANTNRDGSGTLATLATGGANGSLVEYVRLHATVTTTAGMVRLFLSLDGGTTKRLIAELSVAAQTVSASVQGYSNEYIPTKPITLPDTNAILYASTHNAEAINVTADGGDF